MEFLDRYLRWISPEPNSGCWIWLGELNSSGYGRVDHRRKGGGRTGAHRASFICAGGTIPAGMQLDHLCRVRCCVNPDHLEVVTGRENKHRAVAARHPDIRRTDGSVPDRCVRGHELTPENLFPRKRYRGDCRECARITRRSLRQRQRATANLGA